MMMDDYSQLIRELPTIRVHVEEHEKLFKRLERLEWNRDSILATNILRELKKPERLPKISRKIPHLMKELATSSTEGEFIFRAWRPVSSPVHHNQIEAVAPISGVGKSLDEVGDEEISLETEIQLSMAEMDDGSDRDGRRVMLQEEELVPRQEDKSTKEEAEGSFLLELQVWWVRDSMILTWNSGVLREWMMKHGQFMFTE